jgi:hypothetical protein
MFFLVLSVTAVSADEIVPTVGIGPDGNPQYVIPPGMEPPPPTLEVTCTGCAMAHALRGSIGWIIIGFGFLMCTVDYFIQKQPSMLVFAVIGSLLIIIVGNAMWHGIDCGNSRTGYSAQCQN